MVVIYRNYSEMEKGDSFWTTVYICYISFHFASEFNAEIYKNSSNFGRLRPQNGFAHGTHWGLLYPKPHDLAPYRYYIRPYPKRDEEECGRCIPLRSRPWIRGSCKLPGGVRAQSRLKTILVLC